MSNNVCRACAHVGLKELMQGTLLDLTVRYFSCPTCGYVQTEQPYWLERAYADPINVSDTGIMARNLMNARVVLGALWLLGGLRERVVDFAGGYGILVRLLRDYGVETLWCDQYCQNLVARGFEYNGETAHLVTAFEVFEHLVSPAAELERVLSIAPNVLISTETIPDPAPAHDAWPYYGTEHGQHIGFFRERTLERLAAAHGKSIVSAGGFYHLITDRPINELGWKVMVRLNRYLPYTLKSRLKSKTLEDFERLSGSKNI